MAKSANPRGRENGVKHSFTVSIWLLMAVFVLTFWFSPTPTSYDPGVGWHIRAGELIVNGSALTRPDPFLFSSPIAKGFADGATWVENQWLAEAGFYLVQKYLGWEALDFLTLTCCMIALVLVSGSLRRCSLFDCVAVVAAALTVQLFWGQRPLVLSFVCFAIVLLTRRPTILLFAVIFLVWANIHPTYPIGLLFLGERALRQKKLFGHWGAVVLISTAVTFINPFGYRLPLVSFGLATSVKATTTLVEWQFTPFSEVFLPFWIFTAMCIFSALVRRHHISITFVVLMFVAVLSRRFIPYAVLLGLFEMRHNLPSGLLKEFAAARSLWPKRILVAAIATVICSIACPPGNAFDSRSQLSNPDSSKPWTLVEKLTWEGGTCRVLNDPNLGGYIILKMFPHCQVFADDRYEVSGEARYDYYRQVRDGNYSASEIRSKVGADFAILPTESGGAIRLSSDSDGVLLGEEGGYALFKL